MNDLAFQYIVERIIKNAEESIKDARNNPKDEYFIGHKVAHYEILDIIKTELEVRDENLEEYGLNIDLEKNFL
ncbi:MAG: transposase [Oscillospiraceae bacterium]|nr:transposase [Oscillospiraceae bacterium]